MTPQDEFSNREEFYSAHSVQKIRHSFLFMALARTRALSNIFHKNDEHFTRPNDCVGC